MKKSLSSLCSIRFNKPGLSGFVPVLAASLLAGLTSGADTGPHLPVDAEQLLPPAAQARGFGPRIHPLHQTFNNFLRDQESFQADFEPTSWTREDYLRLINGVVLATRPFQVRDPEHPFYGHLLDPWFDPTHYHHYATPHYAYNVALLAVSGYNTDPELLEGGILAYDVSIERMVQGLRLRDLDGSPPWVCGDFYTFIMMRALPLFKELVDEQQYQHWRERLAAIEPEKAYMQRMVHNNWSVKNGVGEFLRAAAGLTDMDWTERTLALHRTGISEFGTFRAEPFTYDIFPRYFLSSMLQAGYRGAHFDFYRMHMWRGAWLTLFLQSPTGMAATGSRSALHCWNEAQMCKLFELYATAYARMGRMEEAGFFKRAARLALGSMDYWVNDDGSFAVVKHRLGPDQPKGWRTPRHGYESYTEHTTYNLMAASMLGMAWQLADDTIAEKPAPADVGGFAFRLQERYQHWFFGAANTYLQYSVLGSGRYDPNGLTRIQFGESSPIFAPSAGLARRFGDRQTVVSTGPGWRDAHGNDLRLAEFPFDPEMRIVETSPQRVEFETRYEIYGRESVPPASGTIGATINGGSAEPGAASFVNNPGFVVADERIVAGRGDFFFSAQVRAGALDDNETLAAIYRPNDDGHLVIAELRRGHTLRLLHRPTPQKIGGVNLFAPAQVMAGGDWHHVAMGRRGNELEIWLDGERIGNQAVSGSSEELLHVAFGANSHENAINPWRGALRRVQFYDRALTQAEIGRLSNGDFEVTDPRIDLDLGLLQRCAPVQLSERVVITPGAVEMTLTFDGPTQLNRFIYPLITDDGRDAVRIERTGNVVLTELPSAPGRGARIQVLEPEGLELSLHDLRLEHPHGFMGILQAETDAPRIRVRIETDGRN